MQSRRAAFSILTISGLLASSTLFATVTVAQANAPAGHSTIHGRAIYQDTERPVRRAPIVLLSDESWSQSRTTVTDGQGEFSFTNVPAGRYKVISNSPGFLNGFTNRDPRKRNPIEVSVDGTSSAEINLRTERGAAITGKITYPDGEPAIGAQINVLVREGKRWSHAAMVSAGAQTDDRGIYRIYPLEAGEYVVSVIEQSLIIEEREGGAMQTVGNKSITPYFYADASSLKSARVIQVEAGREVNNVNITLAERATYRVAGKILASGKPLAGAYLRLDPRDEGLSGPTLMRPFGLAVRSDKDGQWVFSDIPDGSYVLELDPTSDQFREPTADGENKAQRKFIRRPLEIAVAGADVSDLVLSLFEGAKISGSIVWESGKPRPRGVELISEMRGNDGSQYMASGRVDPQSKGVFLIEGVAAGANILRVNAWDGSYFIKSITWNDRDLMRQPLKVIEGQEMKDVRIVLSADVGTLTGHLFSGNAKSPLSNTLFMLVPTDELRWSRMDAFVLSYTDKQGAFKLSGAPGEYILLTQPPGEKQLKLFDYVRVHAAAAPRVALKAGETGSVEIVMPLD